MVLRCRGDGKSCVCLDRKSAATFHFPERGTILKSILTIPSSHFLVSATSCFGFLDILGMEIQVTSE